MGRPRKNVEAVDAIVEEMFEELPLEEVLPELIDAEEAPDEPEPDFKDVFIFTNSDTGTHHWFDTLTALETFKVDKVGVVRTGIYNVKHDNIDVIRG